MDRIGRVAAIGFLLLVAAVAAACGPDRSSPAGTAGPPETPPPAEPTPTPTIAAVIDSAEGPIWNAIPRELMLFAGAQPIEVQEPVSAAFEHPAEAASPEDVVSAYVGAMSAGGWNAVQAGPLEDGSLLVDATRDGTACHTRIQATPLGGVVRITVLYGADCPRP